MKNNMKIIMVAFIAISFLWIGCTSEQGADASTSVSYIANGSTFFDATAKAGQILCGDTGTGNTTYTLGIDSDGKIQFTQLTANTTDSPSCTKSKLTAIPNAGDSVFKSEISGTFTTAKADDANESIVFQRAAAGDFNKDGAGLSFAGNLDLLYYQVEIKGDAEIVLKKYAYISNSALKTSAILGSTAGTISSTSTVTMNAAGTLAAGDHKFTITIEQASTGAAKVTVKLDAISVTDTDILTTALGTGSGTAMCVAQLTATNTTCDATPTTEVTPIWGIFTNSAVTFTAINFTMTGNVETTGATAGTKNFPTVSGLKITK